ncbi:MAG: hypothetical protein U1D32_03000 [Patescibacteria group bacterium]|nr:hypothetical protein [Patescibacteria group bacterium]
MKTLTPASLYMNYKGASYIPLNIVGLPKEIDVLGKHWSRKDEFHSSIVYIKRIAVDVGKALGVQESDAENKLWEATEKCYDPKEQFTITPTGELRTARFDREGVTEETIVVMVTVNGIKPFFERLEKALGVGIEIPPTHITAYIIPSGGIGVPIPDGQALQERTELLAGAELSTVKKAMKFDQVFGA